MLQAPNLVLREANRKERAKISLFDSTVKTRIDEIAKNIQLQVFEKIKKLCDLPSYVKRQPILLRCLSCWFRYASLNLLHLKKKMLFCKPQQKTT